MNKVVQINQKKTYSVEDVDQLLPLLNKITAAASSEVRSLIDQIDSIAGKNESAVVEIELQINAIITRWQSKIEKLGAEPKGLWIADFDFGKGFLCWKFPESKISAWHGYDEGYSCRKPIEKRVDRTGAEPQM